MAGERGNVLRSVSGEMQEKPRRTRLDLHPDTFRTRRAGYAGKGDPESILAAAGGKKVLLHDPLHTEALYDR